MNLEQNENTPHSHRKSRREKQQEEKKHHIDEVIDEASDESFPASDPPAWINHKEDAAGEGCPPCTLELTTNIFKFCKKR